MHLILTKYAERVNPNKEFFRISIKELTLFFNLIDGKYYNIKDDIVRCRNIQKCFIDKQKIRHKIGDNVWKGIYYSEKNIILSNEKEYGGRSPLNQFVIGMLQMYEGKFDLAIESYRKFLQSNPKDIITTSALALHSLPFTSSIF